MDNIEQDPWPFLSPYWMEFPETPYITFPCISHRQSKFGSEQSIMNGTLLGEQIIFSAVSRLLFDGLS